MKTLDERLAQVEVRLARIEQLLPVMPVARVTESDTPAQVAEAAVAEPGRASRPPAAAPSPARKMTDPGYGSASSALTVTQILGWTGATALVLAVAYLIRLALDAGWLTPERQLGLAVLSGFALIGAGLKLRAADRQYASLLPAGGLVVLFLSIYGAHLYYHFIGAPLATGAVILTCLAAPICWPLTWPCWGSIFCGSRWRRANGGRPLLFRQSSSRSSSAARSAFPFATSAR